MNSHWTAFGSLFFLLHQDRLLWLLNAPIIGRWFRRVLRISGDSSSVGSLKIDRILPNAIFWWEGPHRKAEFRTHAKFSKRLYYAFAPLWWAMHAWDWCVADRWVPELSFGFSVLTRYPDADPETYTVDGAVQHNVGAYDTWANIRDGAGTGAFPSAASEDALWIAAGNVAGKWQLVSRGIFLFDTSTLTAGASISAAVLSLYGQSKQDVEGWAPNIDIYTSAPASNTDIVAGDFDSLGTTSQTGSAITYAGFSTAGYNAFTLDATGRGNVSLTGISKFGSRNANYDVANSAPAFTAFASNGIQIYYADQAGTANDPKLVVTYLRTDYQNVQGKVVANSTLRRDIRYLGTVQGKPVVEGVRIVKRVRDGTVQGKPVVEGVRIVKRVRDGTVQGKPVVNAVLAKSKVTSGTIEAKPVAEAVTQKGKVPTTGVEADIASDSTYAYVAGQAGGTAHPYVGTVEADAVVESDRYKQLVREGSVEADVDATTVHSRLKSYVGAVEGEVVAQATPAKSKSYTASAEIDVALDSERAKGKYKLGSVESEVVAGSDRYKNIVRDGLNESRIVSDSAYALAASGGTAHPYVGTVEAIVVESADRYRAKDYAGSVQGEFAVDSVRYKGKVYIGDLSTVIVLDSVYAKATAGAHVYVGTVELIVQESSVIAAGKAYKSGANLVVVVEGAYARSHPTAHPYTGSVYVTVQPDSVYQFAPFVVIYRVKEDKPHDGYILEPLPGRPSGQDGVWTEDGQDGAVTEPPAQGAYTDIGYYKEWKPWYQPYIQESLPIRPLGKEWKPLYQSNVKEGKPI